MKRFAVEVNGWNYENEIVEDSTEVLAESREEAEEDAIRMIVLRSAIIEIGEVRSYNLGESK